MFLNRVITRTLLRNSSSRQFSSFEVGDFCMLRQVRTNKKFFVGPLREAGERGVKGGVIAHDNILGKKPRTVIQTGNEKLGYMIHFPTLEEYVLNVPRGCTPIYPKDTATIVQMLDLEPGHRVLEAGTGNGSLTLYMARAIAETGTIDTFDIVETHSLTAKKHVERYQRGRYRNNVNFHLGPVADMLPSLGSPDELQYDAIALDMPEPCDQIPKLLPYLKNDRFIVCYLPNMTQVLQLAEMIIELPLVMDACIEAEWKEWEVRATHIRSRLKKKKQLEEELEKEKEKGEAEAEAEGEGGNQKEMEQEVSSNLPSDSKAWICRPKNFDVKGHTAFLVKLRKAVAVN